MSITATKTPSGKWTAMGYYRDQDGKNHRKRFTHDKKKEAERLALEWSEENILGKYAPVTFQKAAESFIERRMNILSPSTIKGYKGILKRYTGPIGTHDINDITRKEVQKLVNNLCVSLAPKTVRNVAGFISAVMTDCRPDFVMKLSLPQNKKKDIHVPTTEEMKTLLMASVNTRWEIPVLLAAVGSLRRSEICALKVSDIGPGTIRINKALVEGDDKKNHLKTTKTTAGNRISYVPESVTNRILFVLANKIRSSESKDVPVVDMTPAALSNGWSHFLKSAGVQPFPFHSLRRFYASFMHLNGVADKYIMRFGGWSDEGTLHRSYEKVLEDKVQEVAQIAVVSFTSLLTPVE